MQTAIVGINWGDEGKGRMVDLLSSEYDVIVRYQGGNNAGHTVVNEKGKFILNLLPSGILREETVNVMGLGMVIDIEHLCKEIKTLTDKGIVINKDTLKISDKATICMPYNVLLDGLEEDRLKDQKFGSTRRGIAPVYSDKYMKKVFKMGELLNIDSLKEKIHSIVEWKNLTVEKGYDHTPINEEEIFAWLKEFGEPLKDYVVDTTVYLTDALKNGKKVMYEAQLGALRDLDYGIFPYTSSSNTIASYAPIGAGVPFAKLDKVFGIMKAYSSCVGEGPFVVEMDGKEAQDLRESGGEFGAATGRPRRVGAFDMVASKYGVLVQGATEIALTKLDILSYMEKIPVCVGYEVDGKIETDFLINEAFFNAKPVFEYLDGFKCDVSKCKTVEDLPENAIKYINYIEKNIGVPITYVSVGPARDEYIKMK